MESERLSQSVIDEDHRLDQVHSKAAEELIKLRWHWTLDASNSDRVTFASYGRFVGKAEAQIRTDAHAYELISLSADPVTGHRMEGDEARRRARATTEKQAVVDAVATARGLKYRTIDNRHATEVRRVREIAREQADRKGTTVEEEAPKIAAMIVQQEAANQKVADERHKGQSLRFIELEGYFAAALRDLAKAEKLAGQLNWDAEERELLQHTVDQIRRLLQRIDQRLAGAKAFDWDAELEEILKGA